METTPEIRAFLIKARAWKKASELKNIQALKTIKLNKLRDRVNARKSK